MHRVLTPASGLLAVRRVTPAGRLPNRRPSAAGPGAVATARALPTGVGRAQASATTHGRSARRQARCGRRTLPRVTKLRTRPLDGEDCVGWCQFGPVDELPRIKHRRAYEAAA